MNGLRQLFVSIYLQSSKSESGDLLRHPLESPEAQLSRIDILFLVPIVFLNNELHRSSLGEQLILFLHKIDLEGVLMSPNPQLLDLDHAHGIQSFHQIQLYYSLMVY